MRHIGARGLNLSASATLSFPTLTTSTMPARRLPFSRLRMATPYLWRRWTSIAVIYRHLDGEEWFMFVETRSRWGEVTARIDMEEFVYRRMAQRMAARA